MKYFHKELWVWNMPLALQVQSSTCIANKSYRVNKLYLNNVINISVAIAKVCYSAHVNELY